MIRQPSSLNQLYRWHRMVMLGEAPPIHDGLPECGWFKRHMVKGGPWVPVRIMVQRDIDPDTGELTGPERLVAEIDGRTEDAARHWTYLTPISRDEYDALTARQGRIPAMQATNAALDLSLKPMRPR